MTTYFIHDIQIPGDKHKTQLPSQNKDGFIVLNLRGSKMLSPNEVEFQPDLVVISKGEHYDIAIFVHDEEKFKQYFSAKDFKHTWLIVPGAAIFSKFKTQDNASDSNNIG